MVMRILRSIRSVNPVFGGPIAGINQITPTLEKLGCVTDVISLDNPKSEYLKKTSLNVIPLGPSLLKYGYSPKLQKAVRQLIQNYDAIIINGLWQCSSYEIWKNAKILNIPYFVFPHGMLDPWFKETYPIKHLKKNLYWQLFENKLLRDASAVLFTSEEERYLAQNTFSPYSCNAKVVNYGTSLPKENRASASDVFFTKYPYLKDKRIFLFLSRIHPKKGCDLLLDAFAKFASENNRIHLVMAGPDEIGWKKKLERLCFSKGISNYVTWTGMLEGDLKFSAFNAAEVFILPSHQENFGIAVAEALSFGLPVLISNKINIWREIQTDNAGLVENDDLEGAINLIRGWLSLTEHQIRHMKKCAFNCFLSRFEITRAAECLISVLKGSIDG